MNTTTSRTNELWETYGSSTHIGVRTIDGHRKVCGVPLGPDDNDTANLIASAPVMRKMLAHLVEAADVLLSNEEHAASGGMCNYQKGSPTWHAWEDLRRATRLAATA